MGTKTKLTICIIILMSTFIAGMAADRRLNAASKAISLVKDLDALGWDSDSKYVRDLAKRLLLKGEE